MKISYTAGGEPQALDVSAEQPLKSLAEEVSAHIFQRCPALADDPVFNVQLADQLLNGLAVEQAEIDLGELLPLAEGDADPLPFDEDAPFGPPLE